METPGDYYREKAELAQLLSEAIKIVEQLKLKDGYTVYADILCVLEQRLEMARYVGD